MPKYEEHALPRKGETQVVLLGKRSWEPSFAMGKGRNIPANTNLCMNVNVDVKSAIGIVDDRPSPPISSIWVARSGNLQASAGAQPCPAAVLLRSG